jgi:hypothetical protein
MSCKLELEQPSAIYCHVCLPRDCILATRHCQAEVENEICLICKSTTVNSGYCVMLQREIHMSLDPLRYAYSKCKCCYVCHHILVKRVSRRHRVNFQPVDQCSACKISVYYSLDGDLSFTKFATFDQVHAYARQLVKKINFKKTLATGKIIYSLKKKK